MDPIPRGMGAQEPVTRRKFLLSPFRSWRLVTMTAETGSLLETATD
jgi:hypothetical protein